MVQTVGERNPHARRRVNDLTQLRATTEQMCQSFLPHSIQEWNELEDEVKEATTIAIFKGITKHKQKPNRVYNLEYTRAGAIEMTRLRCENGNLKENLHSRSLALSPLRECSEIDSNCHYFITCPLYDNCQQTAMDSVPGWDWILQAMIQNRMISMKSYRWQPRNVSMRPKDFIKS